MGLGLFLTFLLLLLLLNRQFFMLLSRFYSQVRLGSESVKPEALSPSIEAILIKILFDFSHCQIVYNNVLAYILDVFISSTKKEFIFVQSSTSRTLTGHLGILLLKAEFIHSMQKLFCFCIFSAVKQNPDL